MDRTLANKWQKVKDVLVETGGAVIAFSGGTDSSLLCLAAKEALSARAVAVTVTSPLQPKADLADARQVASEIGIEHRVVSLDVLKDPDVSMNEPDRCYHCKRRIMSLLLQIARSEGYSCVCDGSNVDDLDDYRPGARAVAELGVVSPLRDAGLTKAEVRALGRELGISTWSKPSSACLASRIPYRTPLTAEVLRRVDEGETQIARLGLPGARLRVHGDIARIETDPSQLEQAAALAERIVGALRPLGFRYVTLDLQGYRTGSMNEQLKG